MNKKIKIVTVAGTRPELIRLSRVIDILDSNLKHVLIHTGQNYDYELNEIFFKDLSIRKPDYQLKIKNETPVGGICYYCHLASQSHKDLMVKCSFHIS